MARKRRKNSSPEIIKLIAVAVVILLIIIIVVTVVKRKNGQVKDAEVAEGTTYLTNLAGISVDDIENDIQQRKLDRQAELRQKRLEELANGDIEVWDLYTDYVILGDSRANGFSTFGFLPEDRVLASLGDTVYKVDDNMESIKALSPLTVFVCYGVNDISTGIVGTPEGYKALMEQQMAKLKEALPNATIYINSILPVREPALSQNYAFPMLDEYNAVLKELCDEQGYVYIDNTEISAQYADLWESDGIHFNVSFYEYWASNMLMAVYDTQEVTE